MNSTPAPSITTETRDYSVVGPRGPVSVHVTIERTTGRMLVRGYVATTGSGAKVHALFRTQSTRTLPDGTVDAAPFGLWTPICRQGGYSTRAIGRPTGGAVTCERCARRAAQ